MHHNVQPGNQLERKYTCILFDIDNTLADTQPLIISALRMCGCQGVESISDEELRSLSPPKLLAKSGMQSAISCYWAHYKQLASENAKVFDPNTRAVLGHLQRRGVSLGIVTSGKKDIAAVVLRACSIDDFFARCLVTYSTCSRRKPYPDPILHALDTLHQPANCAIYVGDSDCDARAAHSAGIHFGLAKWARLGKIDQHVLAPDVLLDSICDLLDYV